MSHVKCRSFPTIWGIHVMRLNADGRKESGISARAPTLPEALAAAFEWSTFYAGALGAQVALTEECAGCGGVGTVGFTRARKAILCRACRGAPTVQTIEYVALAQEDCEIRRCGEICTPVRKVDPPASLLRGD